MKKHKKSGFTIVEAVIALTVIVLVCATALTIVLSSVSAKVAAVNKSRAQSFASDAFECFKVSDTEQEFIDNMSFAGGRRTDVYRWFLQIYLPKIQIYCGNYVKLSRAKEIALEDSGCPDSKKIVFTTEELVDGGIKTPYYHFVFNDGRTQWTYRIDATLGIVLEKSKASLIKAS